MAEYIERQAAIKAISTAMEKVDRKIMRDRLMSIPAADVRPVVRGKWSHEHLASTTGGSYPVTRCSVCQNAMPFEWETHFCPNCGADMRAEEGE